nr:cytochrome c oxidase subunit III [Nelidina sp. n.]
MKNHPFHLVENSPWPIISSLSALSLTSSLILWIHMNENTLVILSSMNTILIMSQWWRDIIRESTFQGLHTKKVIKSMKWGMVLFIMSEIMFFVSFFWVFFHSSLSPSIEIGMEWPPLGIKPFNPLSIPLLNTLILLLSGTFITWAHNSFYLNNLNESIKSMKFTIMLGVYFSLLQMIEYYEAPFSISDSIYGSTFFLTTGFHGLHVLIGTAFIVISMMRMNPIHMSNIHNVGFEASAWYWHFVDVVWLFLYISMYWWGS